MQAAALKRSELASGVGALVLGIGLGRRPRTLAILFANCLAACLPSQPIRIGDGSGVGMPAETSSYRRPVSDTDLELWPDPRDRTSVRLERLLGILEQFSAREGRIPRTLAEAIPAVRFDAMILDPDGWGTSFRYIPAAHDFDLRSAGPDRQFDTGDDVVTSRFRPPPNLRAAQGEEGTGGRRFGSQRCLYSSTGVMLVDSAAVSDSMLSFRPFPPPFAGGMAWFAAGEALSVSRRAFIRYGPPHFFPVDDLRRVGFKDGVALYAPRWHSNEPEQIFVAASLCQVHAYVLAR